MAEHAHTNRLIHESSPYLLQHAHNPVDWYPWGAEPLGRAGAEDKPILLSIGYSACHWCHVMERESFDDEQTAAYMNEHFVPVKLDREERPDLDAIYMEACQAMTGHGGWPLNVFVTPEQVPFYAGTYYPPEPRQGMPSWPTVLSAVAQAWDTQREEIRDDAVAQLGMQYDTTSGGWGGAPKFPAASTIEFLLRRGETRMTLYTLRSMASGGIYDQIGGGFARYSVDANWTVPHFEKMLYDNALLARAYLHGWQVSGGSDGGDPILRRTAEETLDWALREMTGPEGAFHSALDADSEGVEGKFYVWSLDELREVLGDDADDAITWFGAGEQGNFEGANILERIRAALMARRAERVRPGLDDKRLTAWNALMIGALAETGAVLEREDYLAAARRAAAFVLDGMRDADGRLLRTYNAGEAKLNAYLEDHAFMLEALLALYEATFEPRWFHAARTTADTMIERFADPEHGGFFQTSSDHEQLVARRKEIDDSPIPSGQSNAAFGLLRLAALTGEAGYEQQAAGVLR